MEAVEQELDPVDWGPVTLWAEAVAEESIPQWPSAELLRAQGGEDTYEIVAGGRLGGRDLLDVVKRPARPGELLRAPDMKYLPDWDANMRFRALMMKRCQSDHGDHARWRQMNTIWCRSSVLYFINVWGWSIDPGSDSARKTPFVTYEMQEEMVRWIMSCVSMKRSGLLKKSREQGASWLCALIAAWMVLFAGDLITAYFMSMREEDVDDRSVDSLLGKVRFILASLPDWMRGGWVER